MTTIGSLGDLHPYIALALEMKKRYIKPVIATTENYREPIESLGIEFHRIRPELPNLGTPEYLEMMDGVVDPNHGAEYLSRSNYKAGRVAKELRELLLNPFYVKRAYQIGHRVRCENGASLAVSRILDRLNERKINHVALRTVA